jgi:putative peptidoglycan lipid II flippase
LLRNIASVGGLTLLSRLFGFVRDLLTAAILGAGPVADAFFFAFRLPNHFRALFAEGAFNVAFVPVFSATVVRGGKAWAVAFAGEVLSLLIWSQLALLVLALVLMPAIVSALPMGAGDVPGYADLVTELTRITFPYLTMIAVVALAGGILNGLGRFAAAAAAPILLNLCLIAALLALVPLTPTPGHALAWGLFAAGIAQFLFLAADLRRAAALPAMPLLPRLTPEVRAFFRALGPATLGAGLTQLSLFADTLIAQALPTGAQSALYYADRLNQLPLGVIGIAVGTVLLPDLAQRLGKGDVAGASGAQSRAIVVSLILTLPFVAAFVTIAEPIVSVLFEHGAFDAGATRHAALVLEAYAFGLPAFVVIRSLLPGFYARGDTATPVRVALVAVAGNLALKFALMAPLGTVGLALATAAGAWINLALLALLLRRRRHLALGPGTIRRMAGAIAAALGMAAILWAAENAGLLPGAGSDGRWPVIAVGLALCAGAAVFLLIAGATGAVRRADFRRSDRR